MLDTISELVAQGVHPGDIVVLAQRGAIGTPIYEGLVQREIPVRSYYAQAELDAEDAQFRFALLKLFVNREDRVALRWLLGLGSNNWRAKSYRRLRDYCDENGTTPWNTLAQLEAGDFRIPYTTALLDRFTLVKDEIHRLEDLVEENELAPVIEDLFPDGDPLVRDIRALAFDTLAAVGGEDERKEQRFEILSRPRFTSHSGGLHRSHSLISSCTLHPCRKLPPRSSRSTSS